MVRRSTLALTLLFIGCGDSAAPEPPGPPAPTAPSWRDAPEALTLGEGQRSSIPLTIDGEAAEAEIRAATGLEVAVEDTALAVRAGYGPAPDASFTLAVTSPTGGETVYEVPVTVSPLAWTANLTWDGGEGPEEREHTTALVDRDAGHAYVFQGSGYHPQFEQMLDDAWRFDLATGAWTAVSPTGDVPPGAGSRRFAGASGASEGYVFGGYGPPPLAYGELHRVRVVDGTLHFEEVPQTNAPAARFLHAFVYDPELDRFFLFGGVSNVIFGDTWSMEIVDGTAVWAPIDVAGPSPRYGSFYGFDARHGRLVIFSGAQAPVAGDPVNAAGDTWALSTRTDPPTWTLIAGEGPPGRRNGGAAWDEAQARLFVFGGTADAATTQTGLFVLDARPGAETWHALDVPSGPPPRSSGLGFHDGERAWFGFGNSNAVYRDLAALGY